jgi:hypothetical protein
MFYVNIFTSLPPFSYLTLLHYIYLLPAYFTLYTLFYFCFYSAYVYIKHPFYPIPNTFNSYFICN